MRGTGRRPPPSYGLSEIMANREVQLTVEDQRGRDRWRNALEASDSTQSVLRVDGCTALGLDHLSALIQLYPNTISTKSGYIIF